MALAYPSGVLPDLRGLFIRGWDNGRNLDGGRTLLSVQGDASRRVTGSFSVYGAKELSNLYPSPSSGAFSTTGYGEEITWQVMVMPLFRNSTLIRGMSSLPLMKIPSIWHLTTL
nr:hypothetical protein [Yersinia enterocolitica]